MIRPRDSLLVSRREQVCSVQVSLPIPWNAAARSGRWLIEGVLVRGGQDGSVAEVLRREVPEPLFSGLEALDHLVPGDSGVLGGMLRRGGVATPDVSALGTPTQMQPPAGGFETLDAAGSTRWHSWIDLIVSHPSRIGSLVVGGQRSTLGGREPLSAAARAGRASRSRCRRGDSRSRRPPRSRSPRR